MIEGHKLDGLVAELSARSHRVRSGLPEKLGGHDEAPNPHELLEMALAACTILTAQLYAQRKGIALVSTDVKVAVVKEGAESVLRREVAFRGDLSDEQRARLLEIVQHCPIHKLLESKVSVETSTLA
jgi:putative redox protein